MARALRLQRDALAVICHDNPEAIRQFEALFDVVTKMTTSTTVEQLSSAGVACARSFVVDSTQTLAAGIGTEVVGGGAEFVPVYCDGTTWRIG